MKIRLFDIRRWRLPAIAGFVVLFTVVAVIATYRPQVVQVSSGAANGGRTAIVLDAGHGGEDPGCVGVNGEYEKDINLAIVKNLRDLLLLSGFDVVLTRNEDVSIYSEGVQGIRAQKVSDMENRKTIIENYPDSIFISIHQNQFTQQSSFGAQVFYTQNNAVNSQLADIMQENFRDHLDSSNTRETKVIDNNLYLFKDTKQPAVLIECGFLSNPSDAERLSNPEYQKKVAMTIFKGLAEFMVQTESGSAISGSDGGVNLPGAAGVSDLLRVGG
jgi:N-acetylmuramoyl-L-alanine amidase